MDNQYALPLELFTHRADGDSVTSAILMDVNGDNSADLVRAVSGTARTAYLNSTGQSGRASGEVIDHIINGLGFEQRIEYHHSDETDVYSPPDSRGSFPVLGVDGPMYLVGAVETSNGMGGFNRSEYRYGDLRVDVAEGRNLGFGWMSVRDPLTGSEVLSGIRATLASRRLAAAQDNTHRFHGNSRGDTSTRQPATRGWSHRFSIFRGPGDHPQGARWQPRFDHLQHHRTGRVRRSAEDHISDGRRNRGVHQGDGELVRTRYRPLDPDQVGAQYHHGFRPEPADVDPDRGVLLQR
ncbi:MAG: hypothetical protein M5U09_27190 [Gammaproteobacteria bacterium]|nr:hypothetical protein [Gammaproteobacteria bacterium]